MNMASVQLNPEQTAAVNHVEGPLLVLAGAGSGKTRVVTFRIAHLLELGIHPADILAVTFTNKAAEEMRNRIRTLKNAQILACTFHSLGARILRESIQALGYRSDFTIYDQEDSEKLLRGCLEQMQTPNNKQLLQQMKSAISSAKNDLTQPEKIPDPLIREAFQLYQEKLKTCNALDFDDLLYLPIRLFEEHPNIKLEYQNRWLFILIDEYQDTNAAQYTLAKILVAKHQNIFAVGDPDQSIYSWRGARYQNILNFESDFIGAKVITLDQNYRSTNTILQAANALIRNNEVRYDKQLWSQLGEGEKVGIYTGQNERDEAQFVTRQIHSHIANDGMDYHDIAIFYRTNAQSRVFEDILFTQKIPYTIVGGISFYDRREVKDILAFLKTAISDTDLISFLRTINLPRRGLGEAALEKMLAAAAERQMPIVSFCQELLIYPALCPGLKLSAKQKEGLQNYLQILRSLRQEQGRMKIHELIEEAIRSSQYLAYIKADPDTFQDRKENLDELIGKAAEWEDLRESQDASSNSHNPSLLGQFLEELSLRSHTEENPQMPSIKLMTLHNSKGLEFPLVFLVGMEEQLLPHINAKEENSIEEERRLCYVGMTRAKRYLYLCHSACRYVWGEPRFMHPSRFLKEIPREYTKSYGLLAARRLY